MQEMQLRILSQPVDGGQRCHRLWGAFGLYFIAQIITPLAGRSEVWPAHGSHPNPARTRHWCSSGGSGSWASRLLMRDVTKASWAGASLCSAFPLQTTLFPSPRGWSLPLMTISRDNLCCFHGNPYITKLAMVEYRSYFHREQYLSGFSTFLLQAG